MIGEPAVLIRSKNLILTTDDTPLHQMVNFKKVRPGSGLLSVKVTMDGPTRVLEITDVRYSVSYERSMQNFYFLIFNFKGHLRNHIGSSVDKLEGDKMKSKEDKTKNKTIDVNFNSFSSSFQFTTYNRQKKNYIFNF